MALGHKNSDPHARLDALERWSARATLLILAGILLDIALVFAFTHGFWERAGAVAANALIGFGLIVEYVVIGRAIIAGGEAQRLSDEKVASAEARAAEANAKALEAQLQLEKWRKPRSLPGWKLTSQSDALKPFAGTPYRFLVMNEPDSVLLARRLSRACRWADWVALPMRMPGIEGENIELIVEYDGIEIRIDESRRTEWWPAVQALAGILHAEEIEAEARVMESGTPPDGVHIFIGRKT